MKRNILDVEKLREKVVQEVIATVRENVGPVASFRDAVIVPRLPKTRSGKIARNTLAAIAAGQPYKVSALQVVSAPFTDLCIFRIVVKQLIIFA